MAQTLKDFEYIIVNDGSTKEIEIPEFKQLAPVINQQNRERVIAYSRGLEAAKGKWICFLNSDDEYVPEYLETVKKMIDENPDYKMFNFGNMYFHTDGKISKRDPFEPKVLEVGHEVFGGGQIVDGTFVFHRSVYEDLGGYPPDLVEDIDCSEINYGGVRALHMETPYDFSAYAQLEFPDMRQFFFVNHIDEPHKIIKELGNPWGNDYYLFFKYTRKYHSKPIKEYLYLVHLKV